MNHSRLPDDLDRRLYAELLPCRPTPADPLRMGDGPTAQWLELERKRELWALAHDDDADEVGAA